MSNLVGLAFTLGAQFLYFAEGEDSMALESECPSESCNAGPHAQTFASPDALGRAGVKGDWLSQASECAFCGCIYTLRTDGGLTIRGYLSENVWTVPERLKTL